MRVIKAKLLSLSVSWADLWPMLRALAVSLALAAPGALAEVVPDGADALVSMELLPGWETSRGTVMSGVRLRLTPGWKTYWRAPGEAGIPPRFSWAGSENLASAGFHWPVPDVFETSGMRSIGYHDEVVIPLELTPTDPARNIRLTGTVDLGICEDICVPVSLNFAADVSVSERRDPAIVAALVDQPRSADEAGVTGVSCSFVPDGRGMRVTASVDLQPLGFDEVVVIESGDPGLWVSPSQVERTGGRLTASANIVPVGDDPLSIDRARMRVTVIGGGAAVDIRGCPAPQD